MAGTFAEELRNGIRSAWCTVLQTSGNFLDALPDPIVDSSEVPIARLNRWLYREFCNLEPPPPPNPPFTGGQCNIVYRVQCGFVNRQQVGQNCVTNPEQYTDTPSVQGPIRGLTTDTSGGFARLFIVHGSNSELRTQIYSYQGTQNCPAEYVSYRILNVIPPPGVPDNCGDPPPITPPPTPGYNTINVNINYSPNVGVDITVPVNFTFEPARVNISGEVTIPIDIDVGNVDARVNGEINLNTGDITFNFGNRYYPPSHAPQPDDYRPDDDVPPVPPDVPDNITDPLPTDSDDESVSVLRGVIVTVSNVGTTSTVIFQNNSPDLYVPDLGHVHFGVSIRGRVAWLNAIPVRNKRHLILCPWEGGAQTVRGTPRPGVVWTLTPVYLDIEKRLPLTP